MWRPVLLISLFALLALPVRAQTPPPAAVPPAALPPTAVPPTAVPPTAVPPAPGPEVPPGESTLAAVQALGERVWERTWEELEGQTVVLGAGYAQGTLKFPRFRGDPGSGPQLTDNGRLILLAQYRTEEQYLAEWPLAEGRAALGYNVVASYGRMKVNRQLRTSAFVGDDVGSSVEGDYVVLAPAALIRLGPLYPHRAVFWKFAAGVGGGALRFQGRVQPRVDVGDLPLEEVSTDGAIPVVFVTVQWELQVEQWLLLFESLFLSGRAVNDPFSYEVYSLSLGYRMQF